MREVLHITTHMGGGVGKALSGVAAYAADGGRVAASDSVA